MRIDRILRLLPAFTLTQPSPIKGEGSDPHVPPPRWGRRGEGGWLSLLAVVATLTAANAHAAPSAAEVAQGGNLFSITCSSSFCHGDAGIGARGPSLHNRDFTPDFVRNTVTNGRSGTPMPAFKDSLSQAELAMIVGYVMSLSPNNHNEDTATAAPAAPSPVPAALSARALAGSALFFDPTRPAACALCHSYKEHGGPIGADLGTIAKRTPRDIYQSMIKPTAPNPDYPVIAVTAENGAAVSGILKQKTDAVVQLYDLSSAPPVLRSFYGAKIGTAPATAPYAHDLSAYSKDDIANLVTFLKSADAASKDVTPQDLTQP